MASYPPLPAWLVAKVLHQRTVTVYTLGYCKYCTEYWTLVYPLAGSLVSQLTWPRSQLPAASLHQPSVEVPGRAIRTSHREGQPTDVPTFAPGP